MALSVHAITVRPSISVTGGVKSSVQVSSTKPSSMVLPRSTTSTAVTAKATTTTSGNTRTVSSQVPLSAQTRLSALSPMMSSLLGSRSTTLSSRYGYNPVTIRQGGSGSTAKPTPTPPASPHATV